jgi:hypothetical protein
MANDDLRQPDDRLNPPTWATGGDEMSELQINPWSNSHVEKTAIEFLHDWSKGTHSCSSSLLVLLLLVVIERLDRNFDKGATR